MIDCFLHTSSLSAHSVGQRKTPRGARPASKTPGHPAGRCRPFVPAARAGRLVRVGAEHRGPPRRSVQSANLLPRASVGQQPNTRPHQKEPTAALLARGIWID
ncbi:unnamed protein product [Prorocentrum cordatum]|uniref:Uncharacterized protein n=1 Tax=Prorocentrum cordatum TaxID=2364126 RepID=A0ABN9V9S0_9DINO|nr:unnamed protein product [Polarella glacialis]